MRLTVWLRTLLVLWMLSGLLTCSSAAGQYPPFTLTSSSSSALLTAQYPPTNLRMQLVVNYHKAGTIFDTVGINAAPAGSFTLSITPDGFANINIYDPARQSAVKAGNGWHVLVGSTKIAPDTATAITVDVEPAQITLIVNGKEEKRVALATPLSGQPVYVGDFPGDDHWGSSFNIHRALVGTVTVQYFGDLAKAPAATVTPDQPATPDAPATPISPAVPSTLKVGAVIAKGVVGPAGGKVTAAGKITVEFPAGALERNEEITIRAVAGNGKSTLYQIERTGGHELLNTPARVSFPIPAGAHQAALAAIEEVEGDMWTVVPATYSPETRVMTAQVIHFTGIGWLEIKETLSGIPVGLIGTALVMGNPTTMTAALTIRALGYVTAISIVAGSKVNETYQKWGLDHYLETGQGFRIWWTEQGEHRIIDPHIYTAYVNAKGAVVFWYPKPTTKLIRERPELTPISVPLSIYRLASELKASRNYYQQAGFKVSATTDVLVHKDFKGLDIGFWDGKYLHLRADCFSANMDSDRRATVAHEYWHAVYTENGYNCKFPWMDDTMATTSESEVFPENREFLVTNPTPDVRVVLGTGFAVTGPTDIDADSVQRGYKLWPWGKFLLHTQGHDGVRAVLTNSMSDKLLASQFITFTRALLTKDLELADEADRVPPDEKGAKAPTGWSSLKLPELSRAQELRLGRNFLPAPLDVTPALSMNLFTARVSSPPVHGPQLDGAVLVIRRHTQPTEQGRAGEKLVVLKPEAGDAVTGRRALDDLQSGDGKVSTGAKWFAGKADNAEVTFPVALIGAGMQTTASDKANSLDLYFLPPPTYIRYEGPTDGAGYTLAWTEPTVQSGSGGELLPVNELVAGYRVFGWRHDQPPVLLTDIPLIPCGTKSIVISKAVADKYELVLGMASVDRALTPPGNGQALMSHITWFGLDGYIDGAYGIPGAPNTHDELGYVPVAGATVTLTLKTRDNRTLQFTAITDAKGKFLFKSIPRDVDFVITAGAYRAEGHTLLTDGGQYVFVGDYTQDEGCVRAGTLVTMADGLQQPIETVHPHERILAYNMVRGCAEEGEIERVLIHRNGPFLTTQLACQSGQTLLVTANHPILTKAAGWLPVEKLTAGMVVFVHNPASGAVEETTILSIVRDQAREAVVYNLKTSHGDYFANGLLVHNKCLGAGSWIDTPAGPRAVERLQVGDAVYGSSGGRRVVTRITHLYAKTTVCATLAGKQVTPHVAATINHRIWSNGAFHPATCLPAPDHPITGAVYDLQTDAGNYYADGVLMTARE